MTLRDPLVVEASPRVPPHSEMSTKPARPDARVTWLASSYVQVLRNPVAHASDGVAIPRFVDAHRAGSLARLDHDVGFSRDDTALKHASSRTSRTAEILPSDGEGRARAASRKRRRSRRFSAFVAGMLRILLSRSIAPQKEPRFNLRRVSRFSNAAPDGRRAPRPTGSPIRRCRVRRPGKASPHRPRPPSLSWGSSPP